MDNLLELSLSENYVAHWTWKEAVREIIQNGLDCKDFEVTYKPGIKGYQHMIITTIDGAIPRSALLLGESGKRDKDKIGKFGEGLKLALLILAREGYDVEINSGKETWIPEISESTLFKGVRTLKINIFENPEGDKDVVEIKIRNLLDDHVEYLKGTFLLDDYVEEHLVASYDGSRVLEPAIESVYNEDEDSYEDVYQCKVYCGGLYVCDLGENYRYSYDIRPNRLQLDRDRKTVQDWDLQFEAVRALTGAGKAALIVDLAKKNHDDVRGYSSTSVGSGIGYGSAASISFKAEVSTLAAASFKERYGERAIPFQHNADQVEVKMAIRAGYSPIFVGSAEYTMLDNAITLPSNLTSVEKPDVIDELTQWVCEFGTEHPGADKICDLVERLEEYAVFMGLRKKEEERE